MTAEAQAVRRRARWVAGALGAASLVLIFLHLAGAGPAFDLDGEHNVPTYFSALLFGTAAVAALRLSIRKAAGSRWPWFLLSAATGFAMVDEVTGWHERITRLANHLTGHRLHDVWMLLYILALLWSAYLLRGWWRRLRLAAPVSAWWLMVGVGCWLASFPCELGVQFRVLPEAVWPVAIVLEESLEMFGAICWTYALLAVPV